MAVAIAWLPGPAGTRRRVAKPSVEEPDAAEPARPDLWGARVSNDPGLPDPAETSPTLREGFAVGANTAAAMLIIFGDNPERIRSEAAFAKLCGACPVPASSGMTTGRHRLYRGGHRQANAALHRAVVVRMRYHQPTIDYVIRRRADGRTKRDIIRCLKRFLAREIYQRVMRDFRTRQQLSEAS